MCFKKFNKKEKIIQIAQCKDGTCAFEIDCLKLYSVELENCVRLIDDFSDGEILYFGFFREGSVSLKEQLPFLKIIPDYFQSNGLYHKIFKNVGNKNLNYLTVAQAKKSIKLFELMPYILLYAENTTVFSPKISFQVFEKTYSNYMKTGTSGFIKNDFSDFIFDCSDTGNFSMSFNPEKNNIYDLYEKTKNVIFTNKDEVQKESHRKLK